MADISHVIDKKNNTVIVRAELSPRKMSSEPKRVLRSVDIILYLEQNNINFERMIKGTELINESRIGRTSGEWVFLLETDRHIKMEERLKPKETLFPVKKEIVKQEKIKKINKEPPTKKLNLPLQKNPKKADK